jgi:hypothetical protein
MARQNSAFPETVTSRDRYAFWQSKFSTAVSIKHQHTIKMSFDYTRDPCPYVTVNDFGGAFCMFS